MFGLFKKKTCEVTPNDLRQMSYNASENLKKANYWSQEKINEFVAYKFLPQACENAKSGLSSVDIYILMKGKYQYTYKAFNQVKHHLVKMGYYNRGDFVIGW